MTYATETAFLGQKVKSQRLKSQPKTFRQNWKRNWPDARYIGLKQVMVMALNSAENVCFGCYYSQNREYAVQEYGYRCTFIHANDVCHQFVEIEST